MSESQRYKIPIPDGYRIFFGEMEVAGIAHRKTEALQAFSGKGVSLAVEAEPTNEYDVNALKVIAFKKGFFRTKKLHIGYIPKETAEIIKTKNLNNQLLPRLKELWVGDRGGFIVRIDILGLKSLIIAN